MYRLRDNLANSAAGRAAISRRPALDYEASACALVKLRDNRARARLSIAVDAGTKYMYITHSNENTRGKRVKKESAGRVEGNNDMLQVFIFSGNFNPAVFSRITLTIR